MLNSSGKYLSIFVILAIILSLFTGTVIADAEKHTTRLAGGDRYKTAAAIALEAYDQADTVIITRGEDAFLFDALAGSVLAGVLDAPILLTGFAHLNDSTAGAIEALGAERAIILGGEGAVSAAVMGELEDAGLTVKRIAGDNRYETAAEIAREVSRELGSAFTNKAFVVSGAAVPDALAIGPYAAANGIPILLVNTNSVPGATSTAMAELGISELTVIGGPAVVSDKVMRDLAAERIWGANRYETSFRVANHCYDAPPQNVIFASGQDGNLVDAMAGGYLGALLNAPILFCQSGSLHHDVHGYFNSIIRENTNTFILGGEGVVSAALAGEISDAVANFGGLLGEPNLGEFLAGDALGRGYDVLGSYADPGEIKGRVLDYDALSLAGLVKEQSLEKATYRTISGKTYTEYQENMSNSVNLEGGYMGFSGSVTRSFSESHYSSSSYEFATIQARIHKTGVFIEGRQDASILADYLSDEFQRDLNNSQVSPNQLFSKFGTHVMTGVILGARLDYSYSANASKATTSTSISAAAQASFEGKFSAGGGFEYDKNTDYSQYYSDAETKTEVLGGASEYALAIHMDGMYEKWMNSVGQNIVFCDYYYDGLMPIWKLAASPARATEISEAFKTWAKEREVGLVFKSGVYKIDYAPVGFTKHTGQGDGDVYSKDGRVTYVDLHVMLSLDGNNLVVEVVNLAVEEGQYDHTRYSGSVTKAYALPVPENAVVTTLGGKTEYEYKKVQVRNRRHDWVHIGDGIYVRIDGDGNDGGNIGVKFVDVRVPYNYTIVN